MKLAKLLAQFYNVILIQPPGQTIEYAAWVIKNNPGIRFPLPVPVNINAIIF